MANPNIVNVTTITGKTALSALSTISSNVITNNTNSNTIVKLNDIILSNYTPNTIVANVILNRSATVYYLGGNISVPPNSTLVLLGKDTVVYLEEGDVLQANVSANSSTHMTASYEIIS